MTRLGLDGIEITLPMAPVSPFGHVLERLTVPAWMLPALPGGEVQVAPQATNFSASADELHFKL